MRLRVVIADDHQLFRDGLRSLLDQEPEFLVVGEASNGRELLVLARRIKPHIAILDVEMPELNGIDAARQLHAFDPTLKIVALSMHKERRLVIEMLRSGAQGYVLKDCALEELVRALRTVGSGRTYLSPDIAGHVTEAALANVHTVAETKRELSIREREVLQLIAEGHTSKSIAQKLSLSVKTVENHRQRIMARLEVHSVAELTKCALRMGLTSIE